MTKNKTSIVNLVFAALLIFGCTKEAEREFPRVDTLPATNISSGGVTLNAKVLNFNNLTVSECGFMIFSGEPSQASFLGTVTGDMNEANGSFEASVGAGMRVGAVYYYTAYAISGSITTIGNAMKFTSEGSNSVRITSFLPTTAHILDTIVIYLNEIIGDKTGISVQFNNHSAVITDFSDDMLRVVVPVNLTDLESTIRLQSGTFVSQSSQKFTLFTPRINSLSDDEVYPGDTVTILGVNFHSKRSLNIVKFNSTPVSVVSSSPTELIVLAPFFEDTDCFVSVTVGGQQAVSGESIKILKFPVVWSRLADYPGGNTFKIGAFAIGNYGYAGLGVKISHIYSNKFWKYDPALNTWSEIANFPGPTRIEAHGFTIDGNGYIGGGHTVDSPSRQALNDYYKYNPDLNQWSAMQNYPGALLNAYKGTFGAVSDKGYIAFTYDDFYSIHFASNAWTQLAKPQNGLFHDGSMFTINNTVYIIGGIDKAGLLKSEVWAYNTSTDIWTRKNDFPGQPRRGSIGFASGDTGFYGLGANLNYTTLYKDVWMYESLTDTWKRIQDFPGSARTGPFLFVIGDFAYIGGGYKSSGVLTNEVYRLTISNVR